MAFNLVLHSQPAARLSLIHCLPFAPFNHAAKAAVLATSALLIGGGFGQLVEGCGGVTSTVLISGGGCGVGVEHAAKKQPQRLRINAGRAGRDRCGIFCGLLLRSLVAAFADAFLGIGCLIGRSGFLATIRQRTAGGRVRICAVFLPRRAALRHGGLLPGRGGFLMRQRHGVEQTARFIAARRSKGGSEQKRDGQNPPARATGQQRKDAGHLPSPR